MNLYEITTGFEGDAYERCYAWATSEEEAKRLFHTANPNRNPPRKIDTLTLLFSADSGPFVTDLSTSGWEK